MNHHFCILPTEASREKHGASAPQLLSPQPWFSQSCREVWRKPQVLLGFTSIPRESRNSEEFWHKPIDLWCSQERIISSTTLRLQRSQAALFRVLKHAIFSIERQTPNYTTLFSRKITTICECTWVHQYFNGWSLELQCRACLPNCAPKFCKSQTSRELSEDLCQKLDISHWMRVWMWWFRWFSLLRGFVNCTSTNQHMGSYLNQAASMRSESVLGKIMWQLWKNDTYFKLKESWWNFFQWILRKIHFSQVIFPEHSQCIR